MFGYIVVNKPELKIKDYEIYRAYYCGLCEQLKKEYGFFGRISLNYDMTFLVLLLDALYEPENTISCERCIVHPVTKHKVCTNKFLEYAADMNIILSYYKCKDDWNDEKNVIKGAYAKLLNNKMKNRCLAYDEKNKDIEALMAELGEKEAAGETDIDIMSGIFGKLLGKVFAYTNDEWEDELYRMGFYLGKFIYICDAYEDLDEDLKKNNYNPFRVSCNTDEFEAGVRKILTMMMAECCREFETLPIIKNAEILRNILYSGVWTRYELAAKKRNNDKGADK